ncbi:MAG: diiron oxygenase [Myxococcales bacterium]|nr:diiron oxygenase [Myxococcales bacterium]
MSVYRPGLVTGDSRTGAELDPASNLLAAFVAGALRLESAPALDDAISVVPVDFVAAAIAALCLQEEHEGRRVALLNPSPLRRSTFYGMLRGRAYRLRETAFPRWRERVLRLPREDPENPLARFALYYRAMTPTRMRRREATVGDGPALTDRETRARLDALGIRCPAVDAQLVDTYLDAYAARGLIAAPRLEVSEARSPHEPLLLDQDELVAPWLAGLDDAEQQMIRLYDVAKKRQWDAHARLDWSLEIDPENPQQLPDDAIPIWRSPVWNRLGAAERVELRRNHQAWQLSQFLAGEQGALLCAGRLVQRAPSSAARMFCATQVVDEARHVEVFARLLSEKLGLSHPVSPPLRRLLDQVLYDRRWDVTCLGMQVLIEGLGLAVFSMIRDRSQHPLIAAAHAYVAQDEARHVAFGRVQLGELYRELSAPELAEREEFVIEASYLLRDRFAARELWAELGLPVDRCVGWIEDSGYMHRYRAELFRRVVPIVRSIGLWGPKVRDAYARMGLLEFADAEVDALMDEDDRVARQYDASA